MQKVLITGGSGFLAPRVRDVLQADWTVLTPTHQELDIASLDSCRAWFSLHQPDAVIHLAAISDIAACERDETLSRRVNTMGPVHLAMCAKETGLKGRFLYASSDQVYTANHTDDRLNLETDPLAPENLYGVEKLEAEEKVSALLPRAIALRLDWMFDLKPGKLNYLKLLVLSVKEQRAAAYALNELRAQTYAWEVAEGMKKLLLSDAPGGAYNFGGPPAGNSYETALGVYERIGQALALPVRGLAVPVKAEKARSLAMDQRKIRAVGVTFRDTVESAAYCLQRESFFLSEVRPAEGSAGAFCAPREGNAGVSPQTPPGR